MSELPRSAQLLPANATALERALSDAAALQHKPEVIASLWDAQRCPVALLPWLAWALSVDEWDESWPAARKRQAVQQSVQLHRKKGTPWAVLRALEVRGYPGCELIIDLENISKVIHERMQREEEKLYPLYLQIAAPN